MLIFLMFGENYVWEEAKFFHENLNSSEENIELDGESIESDEKSKIKNNILGDIIYKTNIIKNNENQGVEEVMVNKDKRIYNKEIQTINYYEEKTSESEKVFLEYLLKINKKISVNK